jgi:hypothetical protein
MAAEADAERERAAAERVIAHQAQMNENHRQFEAAKEARR